MEAGADDVLDRSNRVLNLAETGWSLLGLSAAWHRPNPLVGRLTG